MKTRFITQTVLLLLITSCSQPTPTADPSYREIAFATTIPFSEWSSSLQLKVAPYKSGGINQDTEIKGYFTLTANNLSPYTILLPEEFGVRLFVFSDSDKAWIETENAVEFHLVDSVPITIPPNTSFASATPMPGHLSIPIHPLINIDEPVIIRAIVVGQFYDGPNEGEEIGAYIEFLVEP